MTGNPNSITDAGVGALCARSAVLGAHLNVKVNCLSYEDKSYVQKILAQAAALEVSALKEEELILQYVNNQLKQN
jgi:glutamate formiminotransferase/formiminotetrahydrofolate cyclodeaminase